MLDFWICKLRSANNYIVTFFRWIFIAGITGLAGGLIGTLFHKGVDYATVFRTQNDWVIALLPVGGLAIIALYRLCRLSENSGTNHIFEAIRTKTKIPFLMGPLIMVSTVVTHLFGGSAGREGAALQLGGSIGYNIGQFFHLDEKDMHMVVQCGMSGVFAALFGTPLTAAVFAIEVVSVGIFYYSSIIPCLVSSLIAYGISLWFGIDPVHFTLAAVPSVSILSIIQTMSLAALCAVLSILFCALMHQTHRIFSLIDNEYLRVVLGGVAIVALTLFLNTKDYNGTGVPVIADAVAGDALPYAFVLKMLFTAITIGCGFKGGEIVPTLFIGATFGCTVGSLLGFDPGFGAALGTVALFCGVVNCPLASLILSIEMFGSSGMLLFAVACGVSYMLSGYYGLYGSQKIMYSKLKAEFININAK